MQIDSIQGLEPETLYLEAKCLPLDHHTTQNNSNSVSDYNISKSAKTINIHNENNNREQPVLEEKTALR